MIPLQRKKFPDSKTELAAALEEAFRPYIKKDGPIVTVSARVFPYLDGIDINLDGALITSHPPPPPKPTGETKAGCEAALLSLTARKVRLQGAPINLSLQAHDIVFHEGRDDKGDVLLLLHSLRAGHVAVSATQLDLEKAIGEVAEREARKQGITIEQTRVSFRARGPRSISADMILTARKLLFRARLDISGQLQIEDDFSAKLSNLKCRGEGAIGSIACAAMEPHLRNLDGRSFSLMSLPLGQIQLRDVRIAVSDTVEVTAEFGSTA